MLMTGLQNTEDLGSSHRELQWHSPTVNSQNLGTPLKILSAQGQALHWKLSTVHSGHYFHLSASLGWDSIHCVCQNNHNVFSLC
jgi:hypothetical protein